MKLIMTLTAVSLLSIACAQGGSDSGSSAPTSSNAGNPGNPPVPPAPVVAPPDYSKISCSTQEDCSNACDVSFPSIDEAQVRQSVCLAFGGITAASCNSVVQTNQSTYISPNALCKQHMVTEIIALKSIGASACSATSGCATYCSDLYIPVADQAILNVAASKGQLNSGVTLNALLANDVVKAALAACLAAPENFVIPQLN